MELLFGIVVGLVILIFLVAVHELGHAIAAIRSGVVVEEFGIGFPPRAWSKKLKNGVLFSLNWLPLGGFVKMQGEYDASDAKGDYGAASFWQKTKILLAGVAVNWFVAALLLTVLAWTGLPKILDNQFYVASDTKVTTYPVEAVTVMADSPAEKAGLQDGDKIVRFAGNNVVSTAQLSDDAKRHQGENVAVVYVRDNNEVTVNVRLNSDKDAAQHGYLGVGLGQRAGMLRAGWSAPVTGIATTGQLSWVTLVGIKDLAVETVRGIALKVSPNEATRQEAGKDLDKASKSVAGPIGILGTIFPAAAKAGLTELTLITAIISLTLAVMNILPIPALDGGRWFTMAIFRLSKTPLTKEREERIQGTGFVALLVLILVVTVIDIGKLFIRP